MPLSQTYLKFIFTLFYYILNILKLQATIYIPNISNSLSRIHKRQNKRQVWKPSSFLKRYNSIRYYK